MPESAYPPATGGTGTAAPASATEVGAKDPSGNLQPLLVDVSGNLKVAVTGAGSGGTSSVDESAFSAGITAGTPAMGVYESSPTALSSGQLGIVALDSNRNVKVNIVAGSTGNSAAGPTGSAVPADADFIGFKDASTGNLTGVSSENLDYDTGAGTAAQTIIGIALPASGGPVAGGTATNPVRVDPTGTTTQPVTVATALPAGTNVIGHVIADTGSTTAVTGNVTVVQGTATNLKAQAEAYQGGVAVAAGNPLQVTLANTGANATAVKVDGSAVTQPVSGTVTANAGTGTFATSEAALDAALISQEATTAGVKGLTAFGAVTTSAPTYTTAKSDALSLQTNGSLRTAVTDALPAGTNVIGHVIADSGSTTAVTQATAANLNATVVGTGTFATQAAQSGTWTVQPGNTPNTTPWLVTSGHGKTPKTVTGTISATTTIISAVTSKRLKVYAVSMTMTSSSVVTVTMKDGASGTALATYVLQSPGSVTTGVATAVSIPSFLFATTAGNLLEMSMSAAVSVTYNVSYWDDDAT